MPGAAFALAAFAAFLFTASAVQAQQPHRLHRIGVLNEAWAANHPAVDGMKEGLRELAFVEGRDVAYEIRFTRGDPRATTAAADELVKAGVELIFTSGEAATLAAKKATQRIPIVFTLVGDPVAVGAVQTRAYPGGNLTGISSRAPELAPKRLEMLKTLMPQLRRVWFIYYAGDVTDSSTFTTLHGAAPRLGVDLQARGVNNAAELAAVLKEIKPGDALFAPVSDTLDIPVAVHETELAARIPAVFPSAIWVSHGAVLSYGPDFRAQGVQAARLVAKILRGSRPQDLPVEGADRIDLAVNLDTARKLGLAVPPKILFRANVIHR